MKANNIILSKKNIDTTITLTNARMQVLNFNVVAFGKGDKTLVLIPGLSDGLSTVKGKLHFLKLPYRKFLKHFRVLVISRPIEVLPNYQIEEMAEDYYALLKHLGCTKVNIWGVSMGGMIAQRIMIHHQEFIEAVCLDVTTAKTSDYTKKVLDSWIEFAENKQHYKLMKNTMELTYTDKFLREYRMLLPFITLITRQKSYDRFITQTLACKNHDTSNLLNNVKVKCLVTGGDSDKILGNSAVADLANSIDGCRKKIYEGLGHASFEEAEGHYTRVLNFFLDESIN